MFHLSFKHKDPLVISIINQQSNDLFVFLINNPNIVCMLSSCSVTFKASSKKWSGTRLVVAFDMTEVKGLATRTT